MLNSTYFSCGVLKCNKERGCFRRDLQLYQITLYSENKIDMEIRRPVAYKSISAHLRRLKYIFLPVAILCIVIIFLACLILFVNVILCMKTSRRLEKKEDRKIQQTYSDIIITRNPLLENRLDDSMSNLEHSVSLP